MFSPSTFYLVGAEYNACAIAPTTANAGPDKLFVLLLRLLPETFCLWNWCMDSKLPERLQSQLLLLTTSGVTGLSVGVNTFRGLFLMRLPCTSSTDDVTLLVMMFLPFLLRVLDQTLCVTAVATLAGNAPVTGNWCLDGYCRNGFCNYPTLLLPVLPD